MYNISPSRLKSFTKSADMSGQLNNLQWSRELYREANTQEKRPSRLAMTPDILHLLKTKLVMANMKLQRKRLLLLDISYS